MPSDFDIEEAEWVAPTKPLRVRYCDGDATPVGKVHAVSKVRLEYGWPAAYRIACNAHSDRDMVEETEELVSCGRCLRILGRKG